MTPRLAYIVMPVGSDARFESKRAVVKASTRNRGWVAHFPLESIDARSSGLELPDVMRMMTTASLIIADLSLERPSCYYELGIAQALGRPTFLLAATGTVIHQAADRDKVHYYSGLEGLAALIEMALSENDD